MHSPGGAALAIRVFIFLNTFLTHLHSTTCTKEEHLPPKIGLLALAALPVLCIELLHICLANRTLVLIEAVADCSN